MGLGLREKDVVSLVWAGVEVGCAGVLGMLWTWTRTGGFVGHVAR